MQTTAVPHAKLRLSQANVRTIARDAGLEALAASIAEHGLLQPLVVTPAKGRKALYDVHAGGRRWRAIGLLIERGLWPSDRLVDVCLLAIAEASPREISLAENILREAMARTKAIEGGMRPPWISVPAFEYWTDFETGCGVVYDSKRAFSPAQMRKFYSSYARYARRFASATRAAVAAGIILPEDAPGLNPLAGPEAFVSSR